MTKTIEDINIQQWFVTREIQITPDHFTKSTTPTTPESKEWILEKLVGRYSYYTKSNGLYPAFEDPKEAVFYELRWG